MCGIVGYVGRQSAAPIIVDGLRRLEYRGYDSAGLSIIHNDLLSVRKKKGRIDEGLGRFIQLNPVEGSLGIGHTRWATHGPLMGHPPMKIPTRTWTNPAGSPSSTMA